MKSSDGPMAMALRNSLRERQLMDVAHYMRLEVKTYKDANQPCFYEGEAWRKDGEPRHRALSLLA